MPHLPIRVGQVCVECKKSSLKTVIFYLGLAYDRRMKRSMFFAVSMAVVMAFTAAVGLCIRALYAPKSVFAAKEARMSIVLDAGHGGADGGVVGKQTKVKESTLNLQITQRLQAVLEDMGFDVILTRKTAAGLYGMPTKGFKKRDMQKRKEIVQDANPDFVVSIHQNYYPSASTRGGQVFYLGGSETGAALALAVQEQLNATYAEQGVKPRASKAAEYFMLTCSQNPSIIVECGFLSNGKDERLLVDAIFQEKIARSIAGGIVTYLAARVS